MNSAEAKDRRQLKLLLVASRHHLSRGDIRSLVEYLEKEDCGFNVTLELSDPSENPELLELYRLVAIPALIKLEPSPKQIFAGSSILEQVKTWLPRWQHERLIKGIGVNLRPKTIQSYSKGLEYFSISLSNTHITEISVKSIDIFRKWLTAKTNNQSPSSTNIYLKSVRVFLNWCYDREYILKVPKIELERIDDDQVIATYLTRCHFRFPLKQRQR